MHRNQVGAQGHPCRQRVCSNHAKVCVAVARAWARDISSQLPEKIQCIDWQVFDGALGDELRDQVRDLFSWNGVGASDRENVNCKLMYVLMCTECADAWQKNLIERYNEHEQTVALVAERDPKPAPLSKMLKAMSAKVAATFGWVVGNHELVDQSGAWLSYGMCERNCLVRQQHA